MASRLSRSLQSISSLLAFLPSTAPAQSPYAAIPLGPTTSSSSQPVSPHDAEKQHAFIPLAPPAPRRNQLAHAWLWVSPILVVALAAATWVVSRPAPETGIVEPYACAPKSNWTLLRDVCAADRGADQQQNDNYELALDRHLTQEQCDAIYPGLYLEVERARDYWKARGGVTQQDLDDAEAQGQARALIVNNRLYVKSYSDAQQGTRTKAALALINEALITAPEPVPDIEFVIQTGDNGIPHGAPWALGRKEKEEELTLMPDYSFFSWPEPHVDSWQEVADHTLAYETKLRWEDKIDKLLWRGAFLVDIRKELWEIAHRHKWGAVTDLDWQDRENVKKMLLTPEQHCDYKFLAHVEGLAYSGRLKYLTQCRSVIVAHKMRYVQHFHHLFDADPTSPTQNLVLSPGRNFDELPAVMDALLADDARAKQIADNSYRFWRHWLSVGSVDCYWRRLFREWREVMAFEPVVTRNLTSYNSFILMGTASWEAH
ncbi:glycosyl transferase family 90-domain-containing protein [Rhodotorula diobovata]|uniref:Glycosyl transferase family 90-domain-containing protein n=1 Tax=Rhodotorula diobovata TaxID=5288 RepID=A0A5C5FKA4_9BASI|nr:glycosyl transferase family 90-domain-containing protein [Rhodotorula diobovata]